MHTEASNTVAVGIIFHSGTTAPRLPQSAPGFKYQGVPYWHKRKVVHHFPFISFLTDLCKVILNCNTALSQKEKDNAIFCSSLQLFFGYAICFAALGFLASFQKILLMLRIKGNAFVARKF